MLLKKKLLSKKYDLHLTRVNKKYPDEGCCIKCRRYPCGDTMDDCKDIDKSIGISHSFTYIIL